MYRSFLVLVFCSLFSICAYAQEKEIKAVVTDSACISISFANVYLLSPDSIFLHGTLTDEEGKFALPVEEGQSYILKVVSIGYESLEHNLSPLDRGDLGRLILSPATYALKSVDVEANVPIVLRKADRIVFDPSHVAAAVNVEDLLRYAPGIVIDRDDIKMFGAQGVKIYINGKEQKMESKIMLQVLKSYPSQEVERIELITTPSAKYSAATGVGIIDIILKKRQNDQLGGSLTYARTHYKNNADDLNGNVVYKRGKLDSNINVGIFRKQWFYEENNRTTTPSLVKETQDLGDIRPHNYVLSGQLDYALTDRFTLGGYGLYNLSGTRVIINGTNNFTTLGGKDPNIEPNIISSEQDRNERMQAFSLNLNGEQKVDEKGKMIWYNLDYYQVDSRDDNQANTGQKGLSNTNQAKKGVTVLDNQLNQKVRYYSGKIDATLPWGSRKFNFGGQVAYTQNTRDMLFKTEGASEADRDLFLLYEAIYAVYAEYQTKVNDKLNFNVGIRMESTHTSGESKEMSQPFRQKYVRLFPSLFMSYNPSRTHSFNLNVAHFINRPPLHALNPHPMRTSTYGYLVGDPYLKPNFIYKIGTGYTYNGVLSFDLNYFHEPSKMDKVYTIKDRKISITRWANYVVGNTGTFNMYYMYNKLRWMSATLIHGLTYSDIRAPKEYKFDPQKNLQYQAYLQAQFFFDSDRKWIGTLSANYQSKSKTMNTEINPLYKMGFGIQYTAMKGQLQVGLQLDNIVSSRIKGIQYYQGGEEMMFDNKFQNLEPRLSISYNWGARLRPKHHEFEESKIKRRAVNDF